MRAGTMKIRILPEQVALIGLAANALGKSRTDCIVEVACEHAREVLLGRTSFKLDEEKFRQFNAMLEASAGPNAGLSRLMEVVDTAYVLSGAVASDTLSKDEEELVLGYRSLDIRGKAGVLGMISGLTIPAEPKAKNIFHGDIGQHIIGDITGPNTVNMPGKKSKK